MIDGIELPQSLQRIDDELVQVDTFTGGARSEIPLYLPGGRDGFDPRLRLTYDSRHGAGVFGMGWAVGVPSIAVAAGTEVGNRPDTSQLEFELRCPDAAGYMQTTSLVAKHNGTSARETFDIGEYRVLRYRARYQIAAGEDRIECWTHRPSGQVHWRSVDVDNVTSLYGINDRSRVSDPLDASRTSVWLLNERFDDKGNVVRFVYKSEDLTGVDLDVPSERHRRNDTASRGAMRYLKRVLYANAAPHDRGPWHYEVVFDYGEHDSEAPSVEETAPWDVRPDAFSDNSAGFEQRTWRRCRRVITFHRFDDFGGAAVPVAETAFEYDDSRSRSVLVSAIRTGFIFREDSVEQRSLPPLTFAYTDDHVELVAKQIESGDVAAALGAGPDDARWIDFYGEGLPGLLFRDPGTDTAVAPWSYIRNLGGGRFAPPEEVPYEDDSVRLDLTEAELAHERSYRPLMSTGPDIADQHVGYLDLNGDSATDVVVASDDVIRWYPSRGDEGFADPVIVELGDTGTARARRLSHDDKASFHIADMDGDGIVDLVRVGDSEVTYWPGLGHGHFGDEITIASPPQLQGHSPEFVMLANLSGRGTADIVYVEPSATSFWVNHCGRRFGPRRTVAAEVPPSSVSVVDLFGRGHDCIVWPGADERVEYLTTGRTVRPDQLCEATNGRGLVSRVSYVSTADSWRRDRDDGIGWLSTVPVPVDTVERTETREIFAGTRSMHRYVFRHGGWDGREQRFAGFAASEAWSGGLDEDYVLPGLFEGVEVPDLPGFRRGSLGVVKRWFHTGLLAEGSDPTEELIAEFHTDELNGRHRWLSGHRLPTGLRAIETTRAHRALRGLMLRTEEMSGGQSQPYRVTERVARVLSTQHGAGGDEAAFRVVDDESVEIDYDPKGIDPRVRHRVVLATDEHGYVTSEADVAYRRREGGLAQQARDSVIVTERTLFHSAGQPTWYRLGIETGSMSWMPGEIERAAAQLLTRREIAKKASRKRDRRHVSHTRRRFWNNDGSKLLEPGIVESRALFAHVETLALDDKSAADLAIDEDVDELFDFEGGYRHDASGWWAPSLSTSYDPSRFYMTRSTSTALGHETHFRHDTPCLAVSEERDAYVNTVVSTRHPRAGHWWRKVDVNSNEVVRRFDPLANLLSVAVVGDGRDRIDTTSLEASSVDDPTAVVTYDLAGGQRHGVASWVLTRHRAEHANDRTVVFETMAGFDACGRQISHATRGDARHWSVTRLVERDRHGAIVRSARPFFSKSPFGEPDQRATELASGSRFAHDHDGRVVRIDHPDGTFETFAHTPWTITHNDAIDNVLDSNWYSRRQGSTRSRAGDFGSTRVVFETRAAVQASAHAQTPTVEQLDPRGRVVSRTRALTRSTGITDEYEYDTRGFVTSVSRHGRTTSRYERDSLGRCVIDESLDGGKRTHLYAASGELLRTTTPDGSTSRFRYDAAGRLTHVFVRGGGASERLVERIVWGGGETPVVDAQDRNLVATVHIRARARGVEVIESRNFRHQVERASLYSTDAQTGEVDLSRIDDLRYADEVVEILSGSVRSIGGDALMRRGAHDALGRTTAVAMPDGTQYRYRFGTLGLVDGVSSKGLDVVDAVEYSPGGAVVSMSLGPRARSRHRYDDFGRPVELAVIRHGKGSDDESFVQDQHVVYDANGNVVSITDRGELVASFAYDGLDRLVKVEGFEPVDSSNGLRRFSNNFVLDEHDNLVELSHRAAGAEWQRKYEYRASNRLRASSRPAGEQASLSAAFDYDACGNMVKGANGETYRWDHENRLVMANSNGTSAVFAYDESGNLARRVTMFDDAVEETLDWAGYRRLRRSVSGRVVLDRHMTSISISGRPIVVLERDDEAAGVRYQVGDHTGSVIAELDHDAGAVSEEEFGAYGVPWLRRGRSEGDLFTKRFGFRGGDLDTNLALVHLDRRWYSPWLGRYIDHVASGALNPYTLEAASPQRCLRSPSPDAIPRSVRDIPRRSDQ